MVYIYAFIVGGIICSIGQILLDKTKLTNAKILVIFVTAGVFLTAIGIYDRIVAVSGAGATVPLMGFGYRLAKGAIEGVDKNGILGALTGGIKSTAAGLSAAIFFGYLFSLMANPKAKR
jgi:stage V sporulation protein AE